MGRQIQFNFQNFVNKTAVQDGKLFVTQSKLKNKKFLETDDLLSVFPEKNEFDFGCGSYWHCA